MDMNTVRQLAHDLMTKHGLDHWTFEFRRFKRRFGQCSAGRVPGTGVIALSEYYALFNEEWMIVDTILHEIAHALVGPQHGHGPLWKATARELGCIPKACSKKARMPPGRYQATCRTCERLFHRHRKPRPGTYYCPQCGLDEGRLAFEDRQALPTSWLLWPHTPGE